MKAKAAVLYELGKPFQIEFVELSEPKENEVLVKIVASGICHSDEVGRNLMAPIPAVLGHEGSGIVEKIGANVKGIEEGDHVVLTYASCGECKYCIVKKPYVCDDFNALNTGGKMKDGTSRISQDGKEINNWFGQSSFATYAVASIHNIIKVDKDVDIALLGPLGCGFQTGAGSILGYLDVKPDTSIAIFGIGAVGFAALMAAKIAGCKTIIAVGGNPDKLNLAKELGATHTINRKKVSDIAEEIKKITGRGVEYAFDTSGAEGLIKEGIKSLGPLGKMALVGATFGDIPINPISMMGGSHSIAAITEGCVDPYEFIPRMVKYYKEGRFPFDRLVKFYEFNEIEQAFKDSASGLTIKPIIKMP